MIIHIHTQTHVIHHVTIVVIPEAQHTLSREAGNLSGHQVFVANMFKYAQFVDMIMFLLLTHLMHGQIAVTQHVMIVITIGVLPIPTPTHVIQHVMCAELQEALLIHMFLGAG